MTNTVSAELYVQATPERIADSVVDDRSGEVPFTLEGDWHRAAWSASLDTWRHAIAWRRGRSGGHGTIDLLPADADRTLVIVSLTTRARSLRRARHADAAALVRSVRSAVERGGPVVTVDRADAASSRRRVDRQVPAAV